MGTTLLAKKANGENPFGTSDDHHSSMANDPAISQIPAGSSFSAPAQSTSAFSNTGASMSAQPQPVLTQAGDNAAQGADFVKNDNTDWINKKWRPVMGWVYMATCTSDFVVFPILWSILQTLQGGQVTMQWQPLTLQGAGLYHIAMGAVLGIAAYGRTKEKVAGAA
jgi:hypothetical protein